MIIIIDNYDSFTYNLMQYFGEFGHQVITIRNDESCIKEIKKLNPTHIIISPGPGSPQEAGLSLKIVSSFASTTPILGVCLGHQTIGHIYGSQIKQLNYPMHGKVSLIYHEQNKIFSQLTSPFKAVRYHSLILDKKQLSHSLKITASTYDGIIMGCEHSKYSNLQGIQFHPESIWTEQGKTILKNFLMLER